MKPADLNIDIEKLLAGYRIESGKGFRLKTHKPDDTAGLDLEKDHATGLLQSGVDSLSALQDKLYAQDRWSVLCIFQAMDAAGKDGTIKHVFSGLNPQGCHVVSFKQPGPVELDHDFLWRHITQLPTRGQIGIHNRSWYEEVLVARVHPAVLANQKLPENRVSKNIWKERLEDIAGYERYLARQGVVVLKFFLNVSQKEQKKRFLARLDEPSKNWKFNAGDVAERRHWDTYMDCYEQAITATATPESPWYVVPADSKWFTRLIVVAALNLALKRLKLKYPEVTEAQRAALAEARAALG